MRSWGPFVIAENPDPESTLPYLLRSEVAGAAMIALEETPDTALSPRDPR